MAKRTRSTANSEHLELAQKVSGWAKKFDLSDDPYLRNILEALSTRKNWPMFATISAFELLPHPRVKNMSRINLLSFIFTLIRNVLVFVPVALTWSAVSNATKAFSVYVSQNGSSVVNFLEFWQNGFGLLAKEWIIGTVAFLDFLLIILVILFTIAISFIDKRINQATADQEDELDIERTELALAITEFFYSKRTLTEPVLRSNVANSLNQISAATKALNASAKSLEQVAKTTFKDNLKLFMEKEKARRKTGF